MTLKIWYDQKAESDLGPGDPPIIVRTDVELDDFLDRVLRETAGHQVPSMIQVVVAGNEDLGCLEVGIAPDRGFVNVIKDDGGMAIGDPTRTDEVMYDYVAHANEIPGWAEIPAADVRRALHEFLATDGGTPTGLTLRTDDW